MSTPLTIICGRCKNRLAVANASATTVQCSRCRFVNVVPAHQPAVEASSSPQTPIDAPPPPAADDWAAAAEMEKTATTYETVLVVPRRKWLAARRDPVVDADRPGGPPRRRPVDWSLVMWATVPLVLAALLLLFLVPWSSILHPNGSTPAPAPGGADGSSTAVTDH